MQTDIQLDQNSIIPFSEISTTVNDLSLASLTDFGFQVIDEKS